MPGEGALEMFLWAEVHWTLLLFFFDSVWCSSLSSGTLDRSCCAECEAMAWCFHLEQHLWLQSIQLALCFEPFGTVCSARCGLVLTRSSLQVSRADGRNLTGILKIMIFGISFYAESESVSAALGRCSWAAPLIVHRASSAFCGIFACSFRTKSWLRHVSLFSLHHLNITKCWCRWEKEVVEEESEYFVLENMFFFDLGDAAFEYFHCIFLTKRKSLLCS